MSNITNFRDKGRSDCTMLLFGEGDGGGVRAQGPGEEEQVGRLGGRPRKASQGIEGKARVAEAGIGGAEGRIFGNFS